MAKYRITVEPEYTWAEFAGWKWSVFGTDSEKALKTDFKGFRWTAKRAAVRWARNHAAGTLPVPKPEPKPYNLDFEVEF